MEVLSSDFSPGLLTPMVASSTRKMSYPLSLILETTSAICSLSASDSLIASPSSFISCFNCWSTWPPVKDSNQLLRCQIVVPGFSTLTAANVIVTPNTVKIDGDGERLDRTKVEHYGADRRRACRSHSIGKSGAQRRTHHGNTFRARPASALAGGHRLCFPGFSIHRRGCFFPRICALPSPANHPRTRSSRNYFHTDFCLVRRQFVLESMEKKLRA